MYEILKQFVTISLLKKNFRSIALSCWELVKYCSFSIESFKVIKITLSGGGPADWIEVKTDNTGYILGMEYHYADWYDHAERKISENSYLWDFAAQIAETER